VLLPLSLVLSLGLVSQGVVQDFRALVAVIPWRPASGGGRIAVGPVAAQEAIKQLGTNGGGFFNANSAHPFENPTPVSNFIESLASSSCPPRRASASASS